MSHEIRTPLNGILGFCELMVDESFPPEDKKIFAQNLIKNGSDLLKLIDDIMDISKIRENQLDIVNKTFNLNQLLKNLLPEFQQSDINPLRKEVSLDLVLGNGRSEIELHSDPIRLVHIYRKLLNNAIFFTDKGFIHFGFEEKETGLELFVEDTGCGIEDQDKELIFRPFFKGENPVIGNKGFGLGLAISNGLVKLLGSELKFSSEVDKGSRFYFNIDAQCIVSRKELPSDR